MRVDKTNGKKARYVVSIYDEMTEDHYYFHYFKDADKFYNNLFRCVFKSGTIINLYDMQKDIRKYYDRIK